MAGFRKDFAALKLAGGEDSSSDDDGGGDLKKKMAARFGGVGKGRAAQGAAHEPEHKGALDALRGQNVAAVAHIAALKARCCNAHNRAELQRRGAETVRGLIGAGLPRDLVLRVLRAVLLSPSVPGAGGE